MTNNLPRLELTEDPNKNNEYIIYPRSINGKFSKQTKKIANPKTVTKKRRKHGTKKNKSTKKKKSTRKKRTGFLDIFS